MKNFQVFICGIAILLFFSTTELLAQHHEEEEAHAINEEHGQHHLHKNHIAVFDGITTNLTHHTNSYSVGVDYEYRITEKFGLGFAGEYIAAESEEMLGGIPVFFHFFKGAKILTAPMLIYAAEVPEGGSHNVEPATKKEANFALRIGTGYDFHIGKTITIDPSVNFDIGNTNALVYGLFLGFGF